MFKLTVILCVVAVANYALADIATYSRVDAGTEQDTKEGLYANIELTTEDDIKPGTDAETVVTAEAITTTQAGGVDTNLYYVYTLSNMRVPVSMLATAESIDASPILADRRTIILVHGHGGSAFTSLNPVVRDAIFMNEDLNVIVVDWSVYASLSYSVAVTTVPLVAENLATFIELLVNQGRVNLAELHLVGFDLGAHVVGITGRTLNGQIGRITGLDPNGKQWGPNSARLRIRDALYVEVIHTDGKGLSPYGIGTPLGNVDFFANGGGSQPGCLSHSCCHDRAFELFAASMINFGLIGYPCASTTQLNLNLCRGLPLRMGGTELNKAGAGVYRINTRRNFPF